MFLKWNLVSCAYNWNMLSTINSIMYLGKISPLLNFNFNFVIMFLFLSLVTSFPFLWIVSYKYQKKYFVKKFSTSECELIIFEIVMYHILIIRNEFFFLSKIKLTENLNLFLYKFLFLYKLNRYFNNNKTRLLTKLLRMWNLF